MAGEDPIIAGMAGRYATALFELARDSGQIETVEQDLGQFNALVTQSEELGQFVNSPLYSAKEQGKVVAALLKKAEITGLTANFFALITKNRRVIAVRDMIKAFQILASSNRGETSADVTTAEELSDSQMDALKAALNDAMGRDVQIDTSVDPEILGGMIVKVGSRMIDNSLRTKLSNLKIAMKEVG